MSNRTPLMMDARRVDGLLIVHAVIDHVRDYVEHGIDNCGPAGTANREPETAVFAQDEGWRHRGQRSFARRDGVALTLNQTVEIWRAGLRGKVVHLVVHE